MLAVQNVADIVAALKYVHGSGSGHPGARLIVDPGFIALQVARSDASGRVIRGEQLQVEISPQGIIRMGPEAKQTRVLVDFDQIVPVINLP